MSTEVRQMFSSIATRYDVTNEVLSLGIHRLWRRAAVRYSGAKEGSRILDCATGTGDLALAFKRKVGESGQVVGTDFCPEMLESAPAKASEAGGGLPGGGCNGPPLRGCLLRGGLDRLRHPQCGRSGEVSEGTRAGGEAGRARGGAGIRPASGALRRPVPLLCQGGHACDRGP